MPTKTVKIPDPRHIENGREITSSGYSDQPYVVVNDDGSWTCLMTTGAGREGQHGQHVVAVRTDDQGRTWSEPVAIEPPDGPEASWVMPYRTPYGRIYAFYTYNAENMRTVIADDDFYKARVDTLGEYAFKYSDDDGRTWSQDRHFIPVREMEIDRINPYEGRVWFFWGVGKPIEAGGAMVFGYAKVGRFGHGFMVTSEGCFIRSDNINTERDPEKLHWETLPDGDHGLRAPKKLVADEINPIELSDGSLYCTYRTIDGHPCYAYSRDGGHTWTPSAYMTYADGQLVKHPRAANFVWKLENGRCLYWYHNHGGDWYEDRNPAWVSGGVEIDGPDGKEIAWSQPEILLYGDDPRLRTSYPDLIEDGGKVFVTETQKVVARVHEVDRTLLDGLWRQAERAEVSTDGLILDLPEAGSTMPERIPAPELPEFNERMIEELPTGPRPGHGTHDLRQGFSIDIWLRLDALDEGQVILDNRTEAGRGYSIHTTGRGTLEIVLNDGRSESRWDCDPGVLTAGTLHHVVVIVDGGPKIVSFVVDGILNDGGEHRQFGWGRFDPNFRNTPGADTLDIGPNMKGHIVRLRIYDRYLRTSEAISSFRAAPGG